MSKKILTLLSIAASLAFASAAYADNHAIKIFTADMAEKILGKPVEPSPRNSQDDTTVGKTWVSHALYSVKGGAAASPQAHLMIRHGNSKDEAKNIFESSKATFKGTDVAGLGDAAYRTQMPAQLNVLKGSNWLIITVGTFHEQNTAAQEQLAKAVLPKITD